MSRQTKPVFTIESETAFGKQTGVEAKDLGIEFVHFDQDDKPRKPAYRPAWQFYQRPAADQ